MVSSEAGKLVRRRDEQPLHTAPSQSIRISAEQLPGTEFVVVDCFRMEVNGGTPDLLVAFVFLFLVSVISLVCIGRKITGKQGLPSDCGNEETEEVAEGKAVEDIAGSSTATPEQGRMNFHVFISFRGEDTRKGFTSHLHKELRSRGITTFIDSERLEKGQRIHDLFKCMEASKIFVPILSKNYASSTWCLKEIAKMVEINKRAGKKRPIIPIFYDVDPSDIRLCRASFEKAFEMHQHDKELGEQQINEWKTALTEAGNISGYCLSETAGDEAKLITVIGKCISSILSKVPFDIQPIGIDSQLSTLNQMLEREKDGVCMIGICGLGGIGKTTLAMALYNQLSPTFEGSCFLSDIGEKEKREGLSSLQEKLMKSVLQETMSIDNVREGVSLIKQRLGSKKVLIILDDVEHARHLEAFTGNSRENEEWFNAGSKIIVTTRNREVLFRHGLQEDDLYFPEGLSTEHSLQLFFHKARISDQLLVELGDLPREIVKVAGGLPLALEVFGSHFSFLKEKQEWDEALETLKSEQHKDVHERLRISYDGLNHREKCMFLDIACFFVGQNKEYPFYMWEGCGWYPRHALEVLQHRSLVKVDKNGRFEMHDQVRDMGKMVVKEEGHLADPLTYSRPWSKDQVLELLNDAESVSLGNPHVHSVDGVGVSGESVKMSWKVLAAMSRLRFIICATGDAFEDEGEMVRFPRNIRWFSWSGCPYQTLTFHNSRHQQLCVLHLSDGQFQRFGSRSMVFPKLKVLDLSGCCNLIQTPDFTHLPSLVKLVFDKCSSLIEMDASIGHLKKLVKLSMRECMELKGLPVEFCELTSLEFVDFCDCEQISVLPKPIGDLKSLKYLGLEKTSISEIPESTGRLQSLERLDLTYCSSLRSVPDSVGGLKNLSWLCLYGCKLLEKLPNSMGMWASLETLDIRNCESLTELPDSLGRLKSVFELSLEGCVSLEKIPNSIRISISGKDDHELKLNGLNSLRRLPDSLGNMRGMRRLSLRGCASLQEIPDVIGRLMSLVDLDLSRCSSLRKIPESVGNLKCLKWLTLKRCPSLEHLPESMAGLESLEVLHMCGGLSVKKVPDFIGKLKNLQELHLREIKEISGRIGGLPRLAKMCIKDCPKLVSLPQLPPSLTYLKVLNCSEFRKLASVSDLKVLKTLYLGGCLALTDLSGLRSFNSLKELILTASDGLGFDLMDKLSKNTFEQLEFLFISGVIDGSDLLFRLPKGGQLNGLGMVFSLTEEPPSKASHIILCVQVKKEGEIVTEGRWEAEKIEDVYFKRGLKRWGVEGKFLYAIEFGEQEEIFRLVKEGQATFRVSTTYNGYQLKMAYFEFTC